MDANMKDIKRWLPGVLISVVLIAAILYFVDFQTMWNSIKNADYRLIGIAAVPLLCVDGSARQSMAHPAA
jgi:uncharacterized membrane protein YbhN (UPF0104 family)